MTSTDFEYLLDINGRQIKEPETYEIFSSITRLDSGNMQLSLCIKDKNNTYIHILSFHVAFKTLEEIDNFRNSNFYKGIMNNFTSYKLAELIKFLNM